MAQAIKQGPLAGVKVLEIASLAPGPFGVMLLADMGAEVLRVDRLTGKTGLILPAGPIDRGRRTIALDLKTPEGIAAVRRLAKESDVIVEGFRPGVAERLGIGPDELLADNPRLVYARMTGWGQTGPLADRAGHDINYISIVGALDPIGIAGGKPVVPVNVIGDFGGGGEFMALGVLAALYERSISGKGQVIDAAMVDGASILMTFLHGLHAAGQWSGPRGTNLLDGGASFYDTYETSDGLYIALGPVEPQFYAILLERLGIEPEGAKAQMDPEHWPVERERFTAAFKTKSRADWTELFADLDACVTPVLSPWEAHEHPHNVARESFIEVDGIVQPAPGPRFSRTELSKPTGMDAGGRDPKAALVGWGLDLAEADALLAAGTVD